MTILLPGGTGPVPLRAGNGRDGPARPLFEPVPTTLVQDLVTTACPAKVISFIAPTGSGKTVAMSQIYACFQRSGRRCHWIWLDEHEGGLDSIIQALRAAARREARDSKPDESFGTLGVGAGLVIEELCGIGEPATIFIDNLNSCTDPRLGAFLDALIFNTPPDLRFVWSSTFDFPINKARAKLGNLIQEIGYQQLALSVDETEKLLGESIAREIGPEAVATIQNRTEGWAAGVRMAQIVLAGSAAPREALATFSGADQDVSALFTRQVLMAFPVEMQQFLFSLSQLRIFSTELLAHVTGDADAGAKLEALLVSNAFVMPLDRNRQSFRLHALFRDSLREQARRELSAEWRQQLLRRASEWCERQGAWQDAVTYALEAGDMANASRLLEHCAPILAREMGKVHAYVNLVDRLLTAGTPIGLETQYWYVYALIFHRRYINATRHHERLVTLVEHQIADDRAEGGDFALRLEHLRICIAFLTDQLQDAMSSAQRWLAAPGHKDLFDVGWIRCIEAICHLTSYNFTAAREALRDAEPIVNEMGSPYVTGWCTLVRGTVDLYEGDPATAFRIISAGLFKAERALGEDASICDTMALIAAKCATDMGQPGEARELLRRGFRSARHHGTVGSTALGFMAALAIWTDEDDSSLDLDELRDIARSYPPRLALMLSCHYIRKLVALGRVEEAAAEAARVGLDLASGGLTNAKGQIPRCRELIAATAIDLLIGLGRDRDAEALIEPEYRLARADGRMERVIELELARMTTEHRAGHAEPARRRLLGAIRLAAPRQMFRPFEDRRRAIAALLADRPIRPVLMVTREEQEFFRRLCSLGIAPESPEQSLLAEEAPLEMPTPREIELLALVDMGLSNNEIAEQANISVATIKWHLKNVFRKFSVSNRTSAVRRARSMGLLS